MIGQMASNVIPYEMPSCPTKPAEQQAFVLDIVAKLCGAVFSQSNDQNSSNAKCEVKRKRFQKLKQQCHSLMTNLKESMVLLEDQLQLVRNDEKVCVAQKVAELEILMATHRANEQKLVQAESGPRHKHRHKFSDREAEAILTRMSQPS
jgi:hypothetical protein